MTTGIDLLLDGNIIQNARVQWMKRLNGQKYSTLLPQDAPVPLGLNRKTMEEYRLRMGKAGQRVQDLGRVESWRSS